MATSHYGALLRYFRKAKRKRLKSVSLATGIDISYLSRIERGERGIPTKAVQIALVGALGLNEEEKGQLANAIQQDCLGIESAATAGRSDTIVMVINGKKAEQLFAMIIENRPVLLAFLETEASM